MLVMLENSCFSKEKSYIFIAECPPPRTIKCFTPPLRADSNDGNIKKLLYVLFYMLC